MKHNGTTLLRPTGRGRARHEGKQVLAFAQLWNPDNTETRVVPDFHNEPVITFGVGTDDRAMGGYPARIRMVFKQHRVHDTSANARDVHVRGGAYRRDFGFLNIGGYSEGYEPHLDAHCSTPQQRAFLRRVIQVLEAIDARMDKRWHGAGFDGNQSYQWAANPLLYTIVGLRRVGVAVTVNNARWPTMADPGDSLDDIGDVLPNRLPRIPHRPEWP